MKLTGKKILITGASQGLGLAVAERCLAEGAEVAVCARTRDASTFIIGEAPTCRNSIV